MALKDMKLTEAEIKKQRSDMPMPEPRKFPYGLTVHLDEEVISKLDMGDMPDAGDEMMLVAKVKVETVSSTDKAKGGKDRSLGLQITHMSIQGGDKAKKVADRMFKTTKES